MSLEAALIDINNFLGCETPEEWIEVALDQQDIMLIDHANCEKKAASMAMKLMYKHVNRPDLLKKMSQLAREELLHFEQVVNIMEKREITYKVVSSSRYAAGMHQLARKDELGSFIDILIIGAIIEARSCERFNKLAPKLDEELAKFYRSLLRSEARHYQDYLDLARLYSSENIDERVAFFIEKENQLILSEDSEFRFHSGKPKPKPNSN